MSQAPFNQVASFMKQGRREEALVAAQRWAECSYSPWSYAAIATVRMSMNAIDEALCAINAAVDWEPEEPGLVFVRARVLFAAGRWNDALDDSREVVRLATKTREGHHVDRSLLLGAACHLELDDAQSALMQLSLARTESAVFAGRILRTESLVAEAKRRLSRA